jgi:hypothetical protein
MLAVLMTLGILPARYAMAQVRIDFLPATVHVKMGERQFVEVVARHVPTPGLAAFQFTVQFAPALIDIVNPNEAFRSQAVAPFAPLGGHPLCATVRNSGATCPDPPWMLTTTDRDPLGIDRINNQSQ